MKVCNISNISKMHYIANKLILILRIFFLFIYLSIESNGDYDRANKEKLVITNRRGIIELIRANYIKIVVKESG